MGPCKEATGQSQENNSCYRTEQAVKCSVSSVKSWCPKSWLFLNEFLQIIEKLGEKLKTGAVTDDF